MVGDVIITFFFCFISDRDVSERRRSVSAINPSLNTKSSKPLVGICYLRQFQSDTSCEEVKCKRVQPVRFCCFHHICSSLVGSASVVVTSSSTAMAMKSGSLPVFATPALVALMEEASVAACDPFLQEGETTVGALISVKHLAPSAIGKTIKVGGF